MAPAKKKQQPSRTKRRSARTHQQKERSEEENSVPKKKRKNRERSYSLLPPFELYSNDKTVSFQEGYSSVVNILKERNNILVLVGAGISVSCGIPDFRSAHDGLYAQLDAGELGLSCAEDLFDYEVFCQDPQPFYKFAKNLYFPLANEQPLQPSCSHKFLAMLEQHNKLLRVYTQNIDSLEEAAGVSPEKVVHAHGSLQMATCCKCHHQCQVNASMKQDIFNGTVPRCKNAKPTTVAANQSPLPKNQSTRTTRTRTCDGQQQDLCNSLGLCNGVLKPNVTFFGEMLDNCVGKRLEADYSKADALLVIGTSLSVAPMSKVISYLSPNIPRILLNRTMVRPPTCSQPPEEEDEEEENDFRDGRYIFDAHLLGFCDDITRSLVKEIFDKDNNSLDNSRDERDSYQGQLLATLNDTDDVDDDIYNYHKWREASSSYRRPPCERVFLFPGANLMSQEEEAVEYQEVAHCDGCAKKIELEQCVYKCSQCFDYDLCPDCFPIVSKAHVDGQHAFTKELQSVTTSNARATIET